MHSDNHKNRFRSGAAAEPAGVSSEKPQRPDTGTMIGHIALSCAGRDAGRLFLIIADYGDGIVAAADGRLRKCSNPKKKKLRHLKPLVFAGTECVRMIESGMCNDSCIRRIISDHRGKAETKDER
ncbi:MAG: KOW domain-containing RNA-binding protein [Clostridia bacterium]|nr:KOW domain-containing RNA-binding protein [Clostridia bacterium]